MTISVSDIIRDLKLLKDLLFFLSKICTVLVTKVKSEKCKAGDDVNKFSGAETFMIGTGCQGEWESHQLQQKAGHQLTL